MARSGVLQNREISEHGEIIRARTLIPENELRREREETQLGQARAKVPGLRSQRSKGGEEGEKKSRGIISRYAVIRKHDDLLHKRRDNLHSVNAHPLLKRGD